MSYFTYEELKCPHCGKEHMNDYFMEKLNALRQYANFPFPLSSAFRCVENEHLHGRSGNSAHTLGRAVDIKVSHEHAYFILRHAADYGFTGIGVQQKDDGRFIHLDDFQGDDDQPRPTVWSY